jgi:F0F1-type ATP synthase assembly protein I
MKVRGDFNMNSNDKSKSDPKDKESRNEALNAFGLIGAIGVDMAACTIGGTYLGIWLDKLWGTTPWMLLLGIMLGLTAGIIGIVKLLAVFGPEKRKQ